jgi:ribosomal-protein-serine acetyltransferase
MGGPGEDLIETERLVLELIDSQHADGLLEATIASRPELLPWMPWAREPTIDGVREMVEENKHDDTTLSFAIVERSTAAVLGVIGLNSNEDGSFELHYWMRTDRTGCGLTTEAGGALLEWARLRLGVTRFTLWAGKDNVASRRVAEKLGFVHIGPLGWRPEGGLGEFDAESYELLGDG